MVVLQFVGATAVATLPLVTCPDELAYVVGDRVAACSSWLFADGDDRLGSVDALRFALLAGDE